MCACVCVCVCVCVCLFVYQFGEGEARQFVPLGRFEGALEVGLLGQGQEQRDAYEQ